MSSTEIQALERPAQEPAPLEPAHHHGPSAFGDDLRRFFNLTVMLAVTSTPFPSFRLMVSVPPGVLPAVHVHEVLPVVQFDPSVPLELFVPIVQV